MEIALKLFDALVQGIREEMNCLDRSNILNQSFGKHTLSKLFQEHVLRYVAVRNFYKLNANVQVRFNTESDGLIDLVLELESARIAFEFKCWQDGDNLQGNDHEKLINFRNRNTNNSGYSVIVTNNDFGKPKAKYKSEFIKSGIAAQYNMIKHEVIKSKKYTICVYLAEPK